MTDAPSKESGDEIDKVFWGTYKENTLKLPFISRELKLLIYLSDSKLSPSDRKLLFSFITDNTTTIPEEVKKRFVSHYKSGIANYNGWQGNNYYTGDNLFLGVLAEYMGPEDFEGLISCMVKENPFNFLSSEIKPEEFEYLSSMPEQEFWSIYDELFQGIPAAAPGTQSRINLFDKLSDLKIIALSRNLSLREHDFRLFQETIPGLSPQEYQTLYNLQYLSSNAQGNPNSLSTQKFKEHFIGFTENYFNANSRDRTAYGYVLYALDRLAISYGLSASDIDNLLAETCKELHVSLEGKESIPNMETFKESSISEVSPNGLPQEVREILEKTGYWELVRDNIACIVFTPEILENTSLEADGRATSVLKRVEIDFKYRDGTIRPAHEIVAILVHEAAHNEWRKENILLQQLTPNERHAYATGLGFLARYKNSYPSSYRSKFYDQAYRSFLTAIRTANIVLGYERSDVNPENKNLPSSEFCKLYGLSGPEELDMSYYPTRPSPEFLKTRKELEAFISRFTNEKELDSQTLEILWDILTGSASMDIYAVIDGTSISGTPKVYAVYGFGYNRTELSETQVKLLAGLFNEIATSVFPDAQTFSSPYAALLSLGAKEKTLDISNIKKSTILSKLKAAKVDIQSLAKSVVAIEVDYNVELAAASISENLGPFLEDVGKLLSKPMISDAYNLANLLSAFSIAQECVRMPSKVADYYSLLYSSSLKKSDREIVKTGLDMYNRLSRIQSTDFKLALLDFSREHITKSSVGVLTRTWTYSAITFRNLLWEASKATS